MKRRPKIIGKGWCVHFQVSCKDSKGHGKNGQVKCTRKGLCPHEVDAIDKDEPGVTDG